MLSRQPGRWARRIAVITCSAAAATAAAVLALAAAAAPAGAHATLLETAPAADALVDTIPAQVALRFDEPVDVLDDAVRVFGPGGERVDTARVGTDDGGATVRAAIEGDAEGTYTVAWRVTSEDSHTLAGSFVFHVGVRTGAVELSDGDDGTTEVAGGIGRWVGFAGTFVAVGAAALALAGGRAEGQVRRRLRPLAVGGSLAAAGGVALALVAMVAESAGRGLLDAASLVPDVAADSRSGQLALLRAALCLAAAAAAAVAALWRRTPAPVLVLAGASLVTATLAGHAWTAPSQARAVAADAIHLGSVAVWTGGLVALLVVLRATDDRARLARRFSTLAVGLVGIVAASGTVSGWEQVGTLNGLTSTTYGQLLLAKVAGFAVLVAIGWVNRSRLVPLVERTVAPLARSIRVELVVAAVVLALTAALIHQPPPRVSAATSGPFTATVAAEPEADGGAPAAGGGTATRGASLEATVDPAEAGSNDIHLYFVDADGAPLAVDAVQVTAATGDVPARRLPATPITADHVTVTGASLPSRGTWTIEVTAVRVGETLIFGFEVPIA
jgi:copper transport protein